MLKKIKARIIALFRKNQFISNVGVLIGGTAGAQILMMLAAPLLTRLYSPEDFGLFAVYTGMLSILTVIASLRYELAIPLPQDDQAAADIVALSLCIVLAISSISALLVVFFGGWISIRLRVPALALYLWLLPLGLLFIGMYQVFNCWAIRAKKFHLIAGTRIKQSITTLCVHLLGYPLGGASLLIGHTLGQASGGAILARNVLRNPEFRRIKKENLKRAAVRYKRFPLLATLSGLCNELGQQLPALMFAAFFSPVAAGLYALTNKVLAMPMAIIGKAVANVFISNAAVAYREGKLKPLVSSIHSKLAHMAMPPVILLIIAGPELFSIVFGKQWQEAGVFASWMSPWLYTVFITSPLSALFSIMEKQKEDLFLQIILLITRVIAIGIGAWMDNILIAVIMYSLGSTFCYVGFLVWVIINSGNSINMIIKTTVKALLASCVCASPLLVIFGVEAPEYFMVGLIVSITLIMLRNFILFKRELSWS